VLQYAAQDVLYLPQVFEKMRKNFLLPYNDKVINSETG
jgi:ribonuclease D